MTKNVVAYLQGGLGNQCFIYAIARAVALRGEHALSLSLDYLADDRVYKRKLALEQFECRYEMRSLSLKIFRVVRALRYKLLRDWRNGGEKKCARIGNYCWDARPYRFRSLPMEWRGTLTLDGYWQSEKYFYDVREQLLRDFQLTEVGWLTGDGIAQQIRSAENSVFLHVRSYKEVPGKEDGQCAQQMSDYYRRAVSYIVEHVASPSFFVFSDDICFARELLSSLFEALGVQLPIYVEPLVCLPESAALPSNQIRDFTLMRLCKHGIIADSSFSWWAGWLGEQERIMKGENPIRIRVNRRVMNDDFWPERWVVI